MNAVTRTHRKILPLSILLWIAFLAACSSGGGDGGVDPPIVTERLTQTVGPAGDTLVLPGELSLEIPAGALAAATEIKILEKRSGPAHGVGGSFEFEPDGLDFALPVQLSLQVPMSELGSDALPEELRVFTQTSSGWVEVPGSMTRVLSELEAVNPTAEASAWLNHFSSYATATLDQTNVLFGVYGFADDLVWAYGRDGVVAVFNGQTVTAQAGRTGGVLVDGWGTQVEGHRAVGYDVSGKIYSYSAGQYTSLPLSGRSTAGRVMRGIDGDETVVIAVGAGGRVFEDQGSGFVEPAGVAITGSELDLYGVKCFGAGEAVAVGDQTVLIRSSGAWQRMDVSSMSSNVLFLRSIWGNSAQEWYAVGFEAIQGQAPIGQLYNFSGTWPPQVVNGLPGNPVRLQGVWGDQDEIYVVGEGGVFYHYTTDSVWVEEEGCDSNTMTYYDVWAIDDDMLAAVGSSSLPSGPKAAFVHSNAAVCELVEPDGGGGPINPGTILFDNRTDDEDVCGVTWTYRVGTSQVATLSVSAPTLTESCPGYCSSTIRNSSENPTRPWRLKLEAARLDVVLPDNFKRVDLHVDQVYYNDNGIVWTGELRCWAIDRDGNIVAEAAPTFGNTQIVVLESGSYFNRIVVEACNGRVHQIDLVN